MKCKLCQKNVGFVSGNKTEASKKYGVDRASVRRHNAHASKTQPEPLVVTGSEKEISFENLITEDTHPDTAFHQIFALANLDPEEYELKDGSLRFSTWEAQGKGGETKQLYSYRGTFQKRCEEKEAIERDIIDLIKQKKSPSNTVDSEDNSTYVLSISDAQALADDTPMMTANRGWTTHGELVAGDYVYGPDGNPKRITATTGSEVYPLYDVLFDRSVNIRASGGHLWKGKRKYHPKKYTQGLGGPSWGWRDLIWTTEDIYNNITYSPNVNGTLAPVRSFTVDLPKPLNITEKYTKEMRPIDPYTLGLWLGNGNSYSPRLYGDIRDWDGYSKVGDVSNITGKSGALSCYVSNLLPHLRALDLIGNKHIPDSYLYAPIDVRLSLIQGLMDSDGSCNGKQAEFSNTNFQIAEGICWLLASLGWKYKSITRVGKLNGEDKKPFIRVSIPTDSSKMSLFRFKRKAERQLTQSKERVFLRQIQSVTPVGLGSAQCITVEGGLYLAGKELVLTHNCGKTDSGQGSVETVSRVKNATQTFINKLNPQSDKITLVPEIVLIDGGDIIENMFNTQSQAYTNDLDLAAQIRVARRLVIDIILKLAPYTEKLTYIAVPSNHGQVRASQGHSQAGTTEADFGLDIQEQVKDAIQMNEYLSTKVQFIRPDFLEETAVYTTQDGTKIAVNHGHRTGGPAKVGTWWAKQDHGRMPGYDADILVVAHFHTPYIQQSGNGRWVLGMSSAEPGSQYFALKNGERSLKGCTMFTTNQGQWSNYEIV